MSKDNDNKFWVKFCTLPRYSFLLGEGPSVTRCRDGIGNWIEVSEASQIVDDMQIEINNLRARLDRLAPKEAHGQPQDMEELIDLVSACPTRLTCCVFHHAKADIHGYDEDCRPMVRYYAALERAQRRIEEE